MKQLSFRERIVLTVGLILVVIMVGAVLLPHGTASQRSLAQEERRGREVAAELERTRAEVSRLETQIEEWIVDGTPPQLVREMMLVSQKAARVAGLQIDDLKPAEPQKSAGFRRVQVQITLSAPFPKAARFLYELQLHEKRYRVQQLRMTSAESATEAVDMDLQLVAFVKGDENDAGS